MKIKGAWTTEGMSTFEMDGWKTVSELAEKKQDEKLLTRIRGQDLFACEAKYHQSCRTKYLQDPTKWRSVNEKDRYRQEDMEKAHIKAFNDVCKVIDKEVLQDKTIVKLADLVQIYISSLQETNYPNANYRGEKLKLKLEKHEKYYNKVSFCCLGTFKSYILYSNDIDMHRAMKYSYELGSRDMITEAATHLRQVI